VNLRAAGTLVLLSALLAAPAALARSGVDSAIPAPAGPPVAAQPAAPQATVRLDAIAAPRATVARAGTVNATIGDYFFDPTTLTVRPGDTVIWTNDGTVKEGHTVTDKNGAFDSGVLKNGDTYSHTFDTAGTFNLFCSLHPKMKQTVLVEAASSGGGGGGTGGTGGGSNGGGSGGGGAGSGGGGSGGGGGGSGSGGASSSSGGGSPGGGGGAATTSSGAGSGGGPTATASSGSGSSQGGSGGGSLPMSGLDAWLLALIGLDLFLAGALIRTRLTS
jgi:plastocyanin